MDYTIDVSNWDGYNSSGQPVTVDWAATGFPIGIMKCSEAMFYDKSFTRQWAAAKAGGVLRCAFHFLRANVSGIAQAQSCWQILQEDFTGEDYFAADFETFDGMTGQQALIGLASFLNEMGRYIPSSRILIYTGAYTWYEAGGATALWAKKYKLWLAQWPWDNYIANIVPLPPYRWDAVTIAKHKALIESGAAKPISAKPFYGQLAPWGSEISIWQYTAKYNPLLIPGYKSSKKQVDYNAILIPFETPVLKTCPTCNGTGKVLA